MSFTTLSWFIFLCTYLFFSVHALNASDCACGYYDARSGQLFTDFIIWYMNETDSIPPKDFIVEDVEHKNEKDFNALYRVGLSPKNVGSEVTGNTSALQLSIAPTTDKHVVYGSGIHTSRKDLRYGSFCALLRSPPKGFGGSSLSMTVEYNETQSISLNVQNTDTTASAWISTIVNHEFPERSLGVNYSTIEANSANLVSPWKPTEYCIDWTRERLDFRIAGNITRSITEKSAIPNSPAPLWFRHWSTGNPYSMAGPPSQRSNADIGWVRMFFNSSTNSDNFGRSHERCSISDACLTSDKDLRGSTEYSSEALQKWEQKNPPRKRKPSVVVLSVMSISFTALLLFHTFIRRAPWRQWTHPQPEQIEKAPETSSRKRPKSFFQEKPVNLHYSLNDKSPALDWKDAEKKRDGCAPVPSARIHSNATLRWDNSEATTLTSGRSTRNISVYQAKSPPSIPAKYPWESWTRASGNSLDISCIGDEYHSSTPYRSNAVKKSDTVLGIKMQPPRPVFTPGVFVTASGATKQATAQRIDYLAGLVALASMLVTVIHFGLTFVPALITPGAPVHYKSEVVAQKTLSPMFLTFSWVGIFFTTSTRFLVARFLKDGDLLNLAEKIVGRAPRLMMPVATVALLEYFFMNCGAIKWLEYLPSITWSTWPYTSVFPTFGDFLSELLELLYLIPNSAPKITFHYCTGVLWTIPVQLQGTWLVILGVIVVREIKTPWKRFAYYVFCGVMHWYARSWGTFLWLGLIITDLDTTYNYKQWIYARPIAHYGILISLFLCCATGFSADIAAQWQPFNFSIQENNLHPDPITGKLLGQTADGGYPAYFIPRLSALVFVTGLQMMVELSTVLQKALSFPLLMRLFPHILTIYLIHGFLFWSLGSWICVTLSGIGMPYWANLCVVAVCCYSALFLSLPILTPVIETFGRHVTKQIWEFAHYGGALRRQTLYPFPNNLFLDPKGFNRKLDDSGESHNGPEHVANDPFGDEHAAEEPRWSTLRQTYTDRRKSKASSLWTEKRKSKASSIWTQRPGSTVSPLIADANDFRPECPTKSTSKDPQQGLATPTLKSILNNTNSSGTEMTEQLKTRLESIQSSNPFRDSFKEDTAESEKRRAKRATDQGFLRQFHNKPHAKKRSVSCGFQSFEGFNFSPLQEDTSQQPSSKVSLSPNGNLSNEAHTQPLTQAISHANHFRHEIARQEFELQGQKDSSSTPGRAVPTNIELATIPARPIHVYNQTSRLPVPTHRAPRPMPSSRSERRSVRPRDFPMPPQGIVARSLLRPRDVGMDSILQDGFNREWTFNQRERAPSRAGSIRPPDWNGARPAFSGKEGELF